MDTDCDCPKQNAQADIVSSQETGLAAAAQIEPVENGSWPLRFAPEVELLLACSQSASDREPGLCTILALPLEWETVLRFASHHRLLPALHAALRNRNDVPASIQSAVYARFDN